MKQKSLVHSVWIRMQFFLSIRQFISTLHKVIQPHLFFQVFRVLCLQKSSRGRRVVAVFAVVFLMVALTVTIPPPAASAPLLLNPADTYVCVDNTFYGYVADGEILEISFTLDQSGKILPDEKGIVPCSSGPKRAKATEQDRFLITTSEL